MSPIVLALAAAGGVALVVLALGGGAAFAWRRSRGRSFERRLGRAAAPLSGPAPAERTPGEESIFRPAEGRSPLAGVREFVERRYPLVPARKALPLAAGAAVAGAAGGGFSMWFLQVPSGWWTAPATGLAGAGAAWHALRWLQHRRETEFIRQLPEIVDQIVRLAAAGVPPLEAISVVSQDARDPIEPVLGRIRDALLAGIDPDAALGAACDRVRIGELTLFAAVIRLQRRAGSGMTAASANLAATLRERRQIALKAHSSTAQTRLTLLVLVLMPVLVLVAQKFLAPQSVEMLFGTEQGTTLLRWGVGLIAAGCLVARAIAGRATR